MRRIAAAFLVLALGGCASFQHAVVATPQRVEDAFSDPVRRTHVMTQVSRVTTTASMGITCAALLSPTIVGVLVCPLVALAYDYLSYEYVLEPISKDLVLRVEPSLVGPYGESGPRADEGEFFTCGTVLTDRPTHSCRPAPAPVSAP